MAIDVPLATLIYNIVKDCARLVSQHVTIEETKTTEALEEHVIKIDRWSERIQFSGMATARDTDHYSRELRVSTPRRFFHDKQEIIITESELLRDQNHIVLLGDPGAGKTTTAKRIIRSIIHREPNENDAHIEFPLLIVARELARNESILQRIAEILMVKRNHLTNPDKDGEDSVDKYVLSFSRQCVCPRRDRWYR